MTVNTIDELPDAEYKKVEAAINKFQGKKRRTREDEHILYDAMTNAGLSPEGADEYINLLLED